MNLLGAVIIEFYDSSYIIIDKDKNPAMLL